ncbi:hypothetical protein LSH36_1051g00030 [Paralvinella palmiformis]|uniref:ACB domain-containing protein n=1 Tax=Paralvinella palmiformis TaxID=53620 RepID=A0AAD9IVM8_9ANNE|nr:hypothetical protein LSH36_1051g00030 [Paralvinella palmiformis]
MADSAEFKAIAEKIRNLDKTPTNDEFAELYSLYKQATSGDCDRSKPAGVDLKEKAKYDAWISRKGMSKEEAAKKYIELGQKAIDKYGVK